MPFVNTSGQARPGKAVPFQPGVVRRGCARLSELPQGCIDHRLGSCSRGTCRHQRLRLIGGCACAVQPSQIIVRICKSEIRRATVRADVDCALKRLCRPVVTFGFELQPAQLEGCVKVRRVSAQRQFEADGCQAEHVLVALQIQHLIGQAVEKVQIGAGRLELQTRVEDLRGLLVVSRA